MAEEPDFERIFELVALTKEASAEKAETYRQAAEALEGFTRWLVESTAVDAERLNSLAVQLVSDAKAGLERLTENVASVATVLTGAVHYRPEDAGLIRAQADVLEALAARGRLVAVVMQTQREVDRRLWADGDSREAE